MPRGFGIGCSASRSHSICRALVDIAHLSDDIIDAFLHGAFPIYPSEVSIDAASSGSVSMSVYPLMVAAVSTIRAKCTRSHNDGNCKRSSIL